MAVTFECIVRAAVMNVVSAVHGRAAPADNSGDHKPSQTTSQAGSTGKFKCHANEHTQHTQGSQLWVVQALSGTTTATSGGTFVA